MKCWPTLLSRYSKFYLPNPQLSSRFAVFRNVSWTSSGRCLDLGRWCMALCVVNGTIARFVVNGIIMTKTNLAGPVARFSTRVVGRLLPSIAYMFLRYAVPRCLLGRQLHCAKKCVKRPGVVKVHGASIDHIPWAPSHGPPGATKFSTDGTRVCSHND